MKCNQRHQISYDTCFRFVMLISGILLLCVGAYLSIYDKTSSATSCFSFGFLLIVISVLSRFKHIKGFGFEAELWEEKQAEAARLVDTLRDATLIVGRQLVFVADKVGKPFNIPKAQDMISLEMDIEKMLKSNGIQAEEIEKILRPLSVDIEKIAEIKLIEILCDAIDKGNTDKAKEFKDNKKHIGNNNVVVLTPEFIRLPDWADWLTDEEKSTLKSEVDELMSIIRKYERRNMI